MGKISVNSRFFRIIYDAKDNTIGVLIRSIRRAEDKYYKIFRVIPRRYRIIIVYSREEFDREAGQKTEIWVEGIVKKPKFVIKNF